MCARTLPAREMIERHVKIGFIETQACKHLLDADLIDISAAPLELMLNASIPDQCLFAFRGIRHFIFESLYFLLHSDKVYKRLETYIP